MKMRVSSKFVFHNWVNILDPFPRFAKKKSVLITHICTFEPAQAFSKEQMSVKAKSAFIMFCSDMEEIKQMLKVSWTYDVRHFHH